MTRNAYTSERERSLFETLKSRFPNNVVSRSYLRQDIALADNRDSYSASFLAENGLGDLPQRRLSRADLFVAFMMGIFLIREAKAKPGSGVLLTYPNPVVFATVGTAGADLEAIYNGLIKLEINNSIPFDAYPSRHFRHVPETQQRAAFTLQNAAGNENVAGAPVVAGSNQHPDDGVALLPQNVYLFGENTNKMTLTIPTYPGIDLSDSNNDFSAMVGFVLEGFLIQGQGQEPK